MNILKFTKQLLLIGGFGSTALIFCYQLYALAKSGEWHWVVLADIFPSWGERFVPAKDLLQSCAHWFITDVWLGMVAIVPIILWHFFTSRDDGNYVDFGGFE